MYILRNNNAFNIYFLSGYRFFRGFIIQQRRSSKGLKADLASQDIIILDFRFPEKVLID